MVHHLGCKSWCALFAFYNAERRYVCIVIINGKAVSFSKPTTICAYLDENQYRRQRIAVEKNGEIVPRAAYDTTILADGDKIEIVSFVGGG